jgi:ATP-dependent Zn protease
LPTQDPVHQISIIQRGMAAGYTMYLPEDEKGHISRNQMLEQICSLLGGRAAEQLTQDDVCTGASNDIQRAINADTIANMQNTNAVTAQLNTMAAANAACCCETQRQIERGFADTNYNMATQACETRQAIATSTRDIIDSNNAGVRSILDFLTQDKIATLTAENQSLKLAASQARQNNYLIEQLKPCPVPAYVVANPNCCTPAYNFNTCLA